MHKKSSWLRNLFVQKSKLTFILNFLSFWQHWGWSSRCLHAFFLFIYFTIYTVENSSYWSPSLKSPRGTMLKCFKFNKGMAGDTVR